MEKSYYRKYYEVEDNNWWFVGRRRIVGRASEQFVNGVSGYRLDAGCGTGGQIQHLGPSGTVVGLDSERLALSFAKRRGETRLVAGSAIDLPFQSEILTTVYALDLLEHLEDDEAGLRELKRVCRPGGHIIITVPAFQFLWSEHDVVNHHWRRYRAPELRDLVQRVGLEIRLLTYSNTLLFPVVAAVRLGKKALTKLRRTEREPDPDNEDVPAVMNGLLAELYGFERHLLGRTNLPFGVSLLCVARKV